MDRSILRSGVYLLLCAYLALHFGAANGITFYQPTLSDANGINGRQKAVLATILATTDLVGRLLAGIFASIGFIRSRLTIALFVNQVFQCIGVLTLVFSKTFLQIALSSGLYGFFYGSWFTLFFSLVPEVASTSQMIVAMGVVFALCGVSTLLTPPIAGAIANTMGGVDIIFWVLLCFLFAANFVLFLAMYRRHFWKATSCVGALGRLIG